MYGSHISVSILIFQFVKRGDNLNLSSASKQKWLNGLHHIPLKRSTQKSKPGAKEHHKSNIADMDGLFLYFSNGNGQQYQNTQVIRIIVIWERVTV